MADLRNSVFILVFLLSMGLSSRAYAYLDPGTGSMFLQLLLGGVAGGLVICKLYWHRLKDMFRSARNQSVQNPEIECQNLENE